jgi:hypothetical protein
MNLFLTRKLVWGGCLPRRPHYSFTCHRHPLSHFSVPSNRVMRERGFIHLSPSPVDQLAVTRPAESWGVRIMPSFLRFFHCSSNAAKPYFLPSLLYSLLSHIRQLPAPLILNTHFLLVFTPSPLSLVFSPVPWLNHLRCSSNKNTDAETQGTTDRPQRPGQAYPKRRQVVHPISFERGPLVILA